MNIGERVGDYEIVEILGAGGMGQVYKVRNTLSERVEAMKVLLPNLENDAGLADRFLREIKVQAALDHPNIAKLHTAMRVGNQLLMFMEFVDGVAISKQLERGPIAPEETARIAAQVLDALVYAHAQGVVHRDIKPANIMLTPSGAAKLMDFGIARMQADTRLTQTGGLVGSLFYMSPEQVRGAEPEPRSDVYSLGVTLYEMATGRLPFRGDNEYQIMSAHLYQAPRPPAEIVPDIPAGLSEIILTAMAKDPAARFQSAAAFRTALSNVFPGLATTLSATGTAPPPLPPRAVPPAPPPIPTRVAPPPVPPPVIVMPPPVPPPVPAPVIVKQESNRGLYMAVGSIVTLLVLIAAVIEGPKLIHGGNVQSAPAPAVSGSGTSGSAAAPAAPVPDTSTPPAAPAGPSQPGWTPVGQSPAATSATQTQTPPAPRYQSAAPAVPPPQAQPQPVSPPPAPPSSQVPTPSVTPPPPPANREYAQLREQFNELSIRANSASAGLQNFQQQQARQGLGLRADIREAKTRLDYQLQEAMTQISSGDYEGARQSMRYAQNAVETIEKFLGR